MSSWLFVLSFIFYFSLFFSSFLSFFLSVSFSILPLFVYTVLFFYFLLCFLSMLPFFIRVYIIRVYSFRFFYCFLLFPFFFRVHVYIYHGHVPDIIWLHVIRDGSYHSSSVPVPCVLVLHIFFVLVVCFSDHGPYFVGLRQCKPSSLYRVS